MPTEEELNETMRLLEEPPVKVKSLAQMTEEVYANCVAKGWYEDDRTFGDMIALGHSEFSEALEAFRDHGLTDATAPPCPGDTDGDGNCANHRDGCPLPKPEGVGSEFADVLIRLLDDCRRCGIDLEFEYERKMAYNRTRPHRHGGRAL